MVRKLTGQSSLDSLKKEAKRWLKQVRSGVAEARHRLLSANPQSAAEPTLRDVQLALAREHGYTGWIELKSALEDAVLEGASRDERANLFLDLACLNYGIEPGKDIHSDYENSPIRRQRAAHLLGRHPELARHSIHTAVVCGDLEVVRGVLAEDAALVHDKGGLQRWEPLLFLAYGRLPVAAASDNALGIARLLLAHGADPNAYWTYRWDERVMLWPVLCGVIGDGESGPTALPPHPQAEALARLLLEHGAEPNQSQAMYNTMLRGDDPRWLELLIEYGLGAREANGSIAKPAHRDAFQNLLACAVDRGHLKRARLLLEHGADPDAAAGRPYHERALKSGNGVLAQLLLEHGADPSELSGVDAFEAACMAQDEAAVRRLLREHPEYLETGGPLLVQCAGASERVGVLALLLDLGISPDYEEAKGKYRAAHTAACNDSVAVLELLAERGADLDARDGSFGARPIGWALHNHMPNAIAFLSRRTRCVFSLVAGGLKEPLAALLEHEPALARSVHEGERTLGLGHQKADPGQTPLFVVPDNEELALEVVELLLARGADPAHVDRAGKTAAERAAERGLDEVADVLTLAVEQSGQRIGWFAAAEEADHDAVKRLLQAEPALVHERRRRHEALSGRRWGVTALHLVAARGDRVLAELLLDAGADMEARASGTDRKGGGTALHWAAHYNQPSVVELLVERGADVNPSEDAGDGTGGVGKTFDLFEHEAIGRYLVEHGARVTLFTAVALGLVERARELLSADPAQAAARQYLEFTPLHLAARKSDARMVELLLERGADPNSKDALGRTPIDLALVAGEAKSFAALVAQGAAPSRQALALVPTIERAVRLRRFFDACFADNAAVEAMLQEEPELVSAPLPHFWPDNPVNGTALHIAALTGNEALIELLLRHGADVTRKDSRYGGTPAGWAHEYDRLPLSEQLAALERAALC